MKKQPTISHTLRIPILTPDIDVMIKPGKSRKEDKKEKKDNYMKRKNKNKNKNKSKKSQPKTP